MKLETAPALLPNTGSSGKEKVRHAKHAEGRSSSFATVLSDMRLHRSSGHGDDEKGSGDLQDSVTETKTHVPTHEDEKKDRIVHSKNSVEAPHPADQKISTPDLQSPSPEEEPLSLEETEKNPSGKASFELAAGLSEHDQMEEEEPDGLLESDTTDIQFEFKPDENEGDIHVLLAEEIHPHALITPPSESKENVSQVPGQIIMPKASEEQEGLSSNQVGEQRTRSSASQESAKTRDDSSIRLINKRSTNRPLNSGESSSLPILERNEEKALNQSPEGTDLTERLVLHEETPDLIESKREHQNSKQENLKPSLESRIVPHADTSTNRVSSRNLKTPADFRPKSPTGNTEEQSISNGEFTIEPLVSSEETGGESERIQRVRGQNRQPVDSLELHQINSPDAKPQQEHQNPKDFSSDRNPSDQGPEENSLTPASKESFESLKAEHTLSISESSIREVPENTTEVLLKSAEQGNLRDPRARESEASPLHFRSNTFGLWIRNILQRHEHRFTSENGWNILEMQLDGNDGSMVVKSRREDDRVSITVGFSDSNLRAIAQAHLGDLKEALQTHYNNTVDFSLSGEGSGDQDTGRRMEQPEHLKKSSGKQFDDHNQPSMPKFGNAREWIG